MFLRFLVVYAFVCSVLISPVFSLEDTGASAEEPMFLYDVGLDVSYPIFSNFGGREIFYGSPSVFTQLGFVLIYNSYVGFGFGIDVGQYLDSGFVADKIDGAHVTLGKQVTEFSLIPLQLSVHLNLSKLLAGYVNLDLWYGYEETHYSEYRVSKDIENKYEYISDDWHSANVLGMRLGLSLASLSQDIRDSLNDSESIKDVYFGLVYSMVLSSEEAVDFNRQTVGLEISALFGS